LRRGEGPGLFPLRTLGFLVRRGYLSRMSVRIEDFSFRFRLTPFFHPFSDLELSFRRGIGGLASGIAFLQRTSFQFFLAFSSGGSFFSLSRVLPPAVPKL